MEFFKYQATGNDFVLLDNTRGEVKATPTLAKQLCHRHFGVGADGLILLNSHQDYDFEFEFYNPDGSVAGFCGNGARCAVALAKHLRIIGERTTFIADDGLHEAFFRGEEVVLKMVDVPPVKYYGDLIFLNTGTQHTVKFVEDVDNISIEREGRQIRYNKLFEPSGTNVNFVEETEQGIKIRTYEKGVEAETLSCGTGVTASALVASLENDDFAREKCVKVETRGGNLKVFFEKHNSTFTNIYLQANAIQVFKGTFTMSENQNQFNRYRSHYKWFIYPDRLQMRD